MTAEDLEYTLIYPNDELLYSMYPDKKLTTDDTVDDADTSSDDSTTDEDPETQPTDDTVDPVSDSDVADTETDEAAPWTDEEIQQALALNGNSALRFISGLNIWFLVANDDLICTKSQAEDLAEELGTNMMLVRVYENAGHDFFSWSNQNDYMTELIGFLAGGTSEINILAASTIFYSSMAILSTVAITLF